jgi:hypothetical protein
MLVMLVAIFPSATTAVATDIAPNVRVISEKSGFKSGNRIYCPALTIMSFLLCLMSSILWLYGIPKLSMTRSFMLPGKPSNSLG